MAVRRALSRATQLGLRATGVQEACRQTACAALATGLLAEVTGSSATGAAARWEASRGYTASASAATAAEANPRAVWYPDPEAEVGAPAPEFTLPAIVDGEVKQVSLSDYKGKYVILFFYPKDFTFVCPTEIIAFSDRAKEFEALNCQLLACSTDTPEVHLAWIKTARKRGGLGFMQIPILADVTKEVSAVYGTLKRDAGIALRGLYVINPEGVLEHVTINNFPIGRNVEEALRVLQAVQYVAEHGEVCPAGWKPGGKTMIADPEKSLEYFESLEEEEAADEPGAKLPKIKSKKDLDDLIASGKKVVVKFWAPWCNKCRMIAPKVDDMQAQNPDVTVVSFDTTEPALENLTAELGVKALPQFRFYASGKAALEPIKGYKLQPLADAISKLSGM